MRMKTPSARATQSPIKGLVGTPIFFLTPNLIFFVTINSVQNFKTVAQPLLGEKFVWVVVGGWVV